MSLTKESIANLITRFYGKIQKDEILGPIFNDIAQVDWAHHVPLICQFWNSIVLKTNEYHGNAYRKHVMLSDKIELTDAHFSRWLMLFKEEAFECLANEDAQAILQKATMIAESLKFGTLPALSSKKNLADEKS